MHEEKERNVAVRVETIVSARIGRAPAHVLPQDVASGHLESSTRTRMQTYSARLSKPSENMKTCYPTILLVLFHFNSCYSCFPWTHQQSFRSFFVAFLLTIGLYTFNSSFCFASKYSNIAGRPLGRFGSSWMQNEITLNLFRSGPILTLRNMRWKTRFGLHTLACFRCILN